MRLFTKKMTKKTKIVSVVFSLLMVSSFFVTLLSETENTMEASAASISTSSLEDMQARAEAIINYEWVPSTDIYTWNYSKYNGSQVFSKGKTVKGMPYTLFVYEVVHDSLLSLAQYKNVADKNYSVTANCASMSNNVRRGPVYGSCCATFVSEVLGGSFMNGMNPRYDSVLKIEASDYAVHIKGAKANQIKPGDALSKKGHIIWVGDITKDSFVVYEQTPPVARKLVVKKSSSVDSNGYFVYRGSVYSTISRIHVTGESNISITAPVISTPHKYYAENAKPCISWEPIESASYYTVDVIKDGEAVVCEEPVTSTSYQINYGSGKYEVYVSAVRGELEKKSQCCSFYIGKLDSPIFSQNEMYYDSGERVTLNWNDCEGATKYHVTVHKDDSVYCQDDIRQAQYSFTPEDGVYFAVVDAINENGGRQTVTSDEFGLIVGNERKPIISRKKRYYASGAEVNIGWNNCADASQYLVNIQRDDVDYLSETVTGEQSYTLRNAPDGHYRVNITAVDPTDEKEWKPSDDYAFYMGKLEQPIVNIEKKYYPTNAKIHLSWNVCEGATGYRVSVCNSGGVVYDNELNTTSCTFTAQEGKHEIIVKSINSNGGYQEVSSRQYSVWTTDFALDRSSVTIIPQSSLQLAVTAGELDPNDSITWNSSNPAVVTVDSNGRIYGVDGGNAVITASAGGLSSSCSVKVNPYPMKINKSALSLTITNNNASPTAKLTASKTSAVKSFVWTSDAPDVVAVDRYGKLTALSCGTANICCQSSDGVVLSKSCKVTVSLFKIVCNDSSAFYFQGRFYIPLDSGAMFHVMEQNTSSENPVIWKSSSSGILAVSKEGYACGTGKKGNVTVTASRGNLFKTSVTVSAYQMAETLGIKSYSPYLYAGKTLSLKSILNKGATEPVQWSSADSSIATVSEYGVVKGISQGTVKIKAFTCHGLSQEATVTIRTQATSFIWDSVPEGMNPVSYVGYGIPVGGTKELSVKITAPENCNDTISWTVSNRSVAVIDEYLNEGRSVRVSGVKRGMTYVTARTGSGKKISYKITVVGSGSEKITLNRHFAGLYVGQSVSLSARVFPRNCGEWVMWSSANPDIARVSESGRITAVSNGTTVITGYSSINNEVKDVIEVTVRTKARSITTAMTSVTIAVGESATINVFVSPEGCGDTITWNSSSKTVISVTPSENGESAVVEGLKRGTCVVRTRTGSGQYRYIKLIVTD